MISLNIFQKASTLLRYPSQFTWLDAFLYINLIIFLHWLCFVTRGLYCHLLDFKMYCIIKHRLLTTKNIVSTNVSERGNEYPQTSPDSGSSEAQVLENTTWYFCTILLKVKRTNCS